MSNQVLSEQSLFMSEAQIQELTGAIRSSKQIQILERQGIPFTINLRGKPKVLLSVFQEFMLGRGVKKKKDGFNLNKLRELQGG